MEIRVDRLSLWKRIFSVADAYGGCHKHLRTTVFVTNYDRKEVSNELKDN